MSGQCPVAECVRQADSEHHVYPRRWRKMWTKEQRKTVVRLCRECHTNFERILEKWERWAGNGRRAPIMPGSYHGMIYNFIFGNRIPMPQRRKVVIPISA